VSIIVCHTQNSKGKQIHIHQILNVLVVTPCKFSCCNLHRTVTITSYSRERSNMSKLLLCTMMDSSAMLCRDTYTEQNIQSHTHISCRRVHYSTRPCFVCNLTSVLIPVQSSSIQDWAEFWESHLGSYQSTVASFPRVELHGAASVVLNFIQGASC